ncbi:Restriction endonuclease [Butyrivibrio sp. ob235]|uniref:restriction endonuclease n=1 Tax=Butyrivibrio sp. ob235 TaxID=1761780 RepID=UPI0008D7787B|nr:restriction endonuclease [Butyrivibrio sp. ob235]SEM19807.1 Restriction endonuclease [Butyrivibrio sp. ob235]
MEVAFNDLETSDLIVDCIYRGGNSGNAGDEPLPRLIPRCEASGGFRKKLREDDSGKYAYVVLYTTMSELEWPDYLDEETGVFRYYGDNRHPGKELTDTKKKGNAVLEMVFALLNEGCHLDDMPPFFIFKKAGEGRDAQFLGLAAPGNPQISPDKDLVAFWRTVKEKRFQNYEAYFTVLNTGKTPISRQWIESLIYDHENNLQYAPEVWKKFLREGRSGIVALKAPKIFKVPSRYEQLQSDVEGERCLEAIRNHYRDFEQGFEACATNIISKMDTNFVDFSLTRPWRDGGRDAIGYYAIKTGGKANYPLKIDCALEAKCYSKDTSVRVPQMSRLISRIRYRQFGIMITTSFVDSNAYKEVVEDGHPILIVTATDIASILRNNAINSGNINDWLNSIDARNIRLLEYYKRLSKV